MFKNNLAKENLAVMYLRLSKEDGEKTESNSISNQREIIDSYARKNQITIVKEYVDDGYSGANFDRPNFKEMIKATYDRKFNTIIVKTFDSISLTIPTQKVLSAFNAVVSSIMQQIKAKMKQNIHLAEARDRLLPKLMSGELEV